MTTINVVKTVQITFTGKDAAGSTVSIPDGSKVTLQYRVTNTTTPNPWGTAINATTTAGVATIKVTLAVGTYDFLATYLQQTINNVTYDKSTSQKDAYVVTATVSTSSVITIS